LETNVMGLIALAEHAGIPSGIAVVLLVTLRRPDPVLRLISGLMVLFAPGVLRERGLTVFAATGAAPPSEDGTATPSAVAHAEAPVPLGQAGAPG
jgi:hypothetical protein